MEGTYDRMKELKAFDDSKAGVKGLVDAGVTQIPRIFIHEIRAKIDDKPVSTDPNIKIPVIDLQGLNDPIARNQILKQVRNAGENWGFFQIINHGIPLHVMDKVLEGNRSFHEQDVEFKKKYYSRDYAHKKVLYNSNVLLFEGVAAAWRDTLNFIMGPNFPSPDEMPPMLREIMICYKNEVMNLGVTLYGLLAEALDLDPNYFIKMGCAEGIFSPCHYYPPCPEPEKTVGLITHADSGFVTVLLQDPKIGGLQVFHDDHWINVKPAHGSLIVNLGDLMQLSTNDKFKSAYHRVRSGKEGPRVSVACIFRAQADESKIYGPIKELLSKENPPHYREVTLKEVVAQKHTKRDIDDAISILPAFKL